MATAHALERSLPHAGPLSLDKPGYFARLAWLEEHHWWSRGQWRLATYWLDHALAGKSGLTAVDLGCGAGLTLQRLRQRAEIDHVIGIDPHDDALFYARQRLESTHDAVTQLVQGSITAIPLADQSCHLLVCLDVLQHLTVDEELHAIQELNRVAKLGATLVLRANAKPILPKAFTVRSDDPQARMYDLATLRDRFQSAGWSITHLTYSNALPALVHELRGSWSWARRQPQAGHPAGQGLPARDTTPRWCQGLLPVIAQTEAIWAGKLGLRLPFGHSTGLLATKSA